VVYPQARALPSAPRPLRRVIVDADGSFLFAQEQVEPGSEEEDGALMRFDGRAWQLYPALKSEPFSARRGWLVLKEPLRVVPALNPEQAVLPERRLTRGARRARSAIRCPTTTPSNLDLGITLGSRSVSIDAPAVITDALAMTGPDNTAVRVALWRALHVLADAPPHVLEDRLGLALVAPADDWQKRPDMASFTRPFRASIVARARFVEDLVETQLARGVAQYVLLGAGLDTFAQRRTDLASRLRVFEVDQPETQAWKRNRLVELGLGVPDFLRLVAVDFEHLESWVTRVVEAGFDPQKPAVVASTGVSMYLTKDAVAAKLREIAALGSGSTLVMSFILPLELAEPELRPGLEAAARGARANGTPWLSFFRPDELLDLARDAGFVRVEHVSADALSARYFANRSDGLRLPSNTEELLVAST
jgi:methyltransferase (TIGR00027 family)